MRTKWVSMYIYIYITYVAFAQVETDSKMATYIVSIRYYYYYFFLFLFFILIHGYCCFLWRTRSLDRIVGFFIFLFFLLPCRNLSFIVIVRLMGWVRRRWKIGVKKPSVCKVTADRPGSSELFGGGGGGDGERASSNDEWGGRCAVIGRTLCDAYSPPG